MRTAVSALLAPFLAVIVLAVSPDKATAQDKPPTIYWRGDEEFCLGLLKNGDKVETVAPVLADPPAYLRHRDYKDYPHSLIFTDKILPLGEVDRAINDEKWDLLFDGGRRPPNPLVESHLIVVSKEWRELDRKCPGLLLSTYKDIKTSEFITWAPRKIDLFRADADNDGRRETILRWRGSGGDGIAQSFDFIDFETCQRRELGFVFNPTKIIRYAGKTYFQEQFFHDVGFYIKRHDPAEEHGFSRVCFFKARNHPLTDPADFSAVPWILKRLKN